MATSAWMGFREQLRLTRLRGHDPQQSVRQRNSEWAAGVAADQRAARVEAVIAEQERVNPFLAARLRRNTDPASNGVLAGLVAAKVRAGRRQ